MPCQCTTQIAPLHSPQNGCDTRSPDNGDTTSTHTRQPSIIVVMKTVHQWFVDVVMSPTLCAQASTTSANRTRPERATTPDGDGRHGGCAKAPTVGVGGNHVRTNGFHVQFALSCRWSNKQISIYFAKHGKQFALHSWFIHVCCVSHSDLQTTTMSTCLPARERGVRSESTQR